MERVAFEGAPREAEVAEVEPEPAVNPLAIAGERMNPLDIVLVVDTSRGGDVAEQEVGQDSRAPQEGCPWAAALEWAGRPAARTTRPPQRRSPVAPCVTPALVPALVDHDYFGDGGRASPDSSDRLASPRGSAPSPRPFSVKAPGEIAAMTMASGPAAVPFSQTDRFKNIKRSLMLTCPVCKQMLTQTHKLIVHIKTDHPDKANRKFLDKAIEQNGVIGCRECGIMQRRVFHGLVQHLHHNKATHSSPVDYFRRFDQETHSQTERELLASQAVQEIDCPLCKKSGIMGIARFAEHMDGAHAKRFTTHAGLMGEIATQLGLDKCSHCGSASLPGYLHKHLAICKAGKDPEISNAIKAVDTREPEPTAAGDKSKGPELVEMPLQLGTTNSPAAKKFPSPAAAGPCHEADVVMSHPPQNFSSPTKTEKPSRARVQDPWYMDKLSLSCPFCPLRDKVGTGLAKHIKEEHEDLIADKSVESFTEANGLISCRVCGIVRRRIYTDLCMHFNHNSETHMKIEAYFQKFKIDAVEQTDSERTASDRLMNATCPECGQSKINGSMAFRDHVKKSHGVMQKTHAQLLGDLSEQLGLSRCEGCSVAILPGFEKKHEKHCKVQLEKARVMKFEMQTNVSPKKHRRTSTRLQRKTKRRYRVESEASSLEDEKEVNEVQEKDADLDFRVKNCKFRLDDVSSISETVKRSRRCKVGAVDTFQPQISEKSSESKTPEENSKKANGTICAMTSAFPVIETSQGNRKKIECRQARKCSIASHSSQQAEEEKDALVPDNEQVLTSSAGPFSPRGGLPMSPAEFSLLPPTGDPQMPPFLAPLNPGRSLSTASSSLSEQASQRKISTSSLSQAADPSDSSSPGVIVSGCRYQCPRCLIDEFTSLCLVSSHLRRSHGLGEDPDALMALMREARVQEVTTDCKICGREVIQDQVEMGYHVWTSHGLSLDAYVLM